MWGRGKTTDEVMKNVVLTNTQWCSWALEIDAGLTVNFANCTNKKEKIKNLKIWLDKRLYR